MLNRTVVGQARQGRDWLGLLSRKQWANHRNPGCGSVTSIASIARFPRLKKIGERATRPPHSAFQDAAFAGIGDLPIFWFGTVLQHICGAGPGSHARLVVASTSGNA